VKAARCVLGRGGDVTISSLFDYYGETTDENESYIIRSKRKKSTNEFYSYVTLYVTTRDRQMTLAVYPVRQGTSKVGYIARCLDRIAELGLKVEVLYLDREFYTRKVFGFLTRIRVPFIVPVRKHGNRCKWRDTFPQK